MVARGGVIEIVDVLCLIEDQLECDGVVAGQRRQENMDQLSLKIQPQGFIRT